MSDFWLGMIFNGMMSAVVIFFVLLVGTDIIRRQRDIRHRLRLLEDAFYRMCEEMKGGDK